MQVRGIIYPIERHQYGFCIRMYAHLFLPPIVELQNAGLSTNQIAAEMSRRRANNRSDWTADTVKALISLQESIRQEDAIARRIKFFH